MSEAIKNKIGRLEAVASAGAKGVKFDGESVWYNPANDQARGMVNPEMLKGKMVEMFLDEKDRTKFVSIVCLEPGDAKFINASAAEEKNKPEPAKTKIDQKESYFTKLASIKANVEKKGGLNYISWAEAWDMLKRQHPEAKYTIYESQAGMPYFVDGSGGMVKVGVTVMEMEHIVWWPIMDNSNTSVPKEKITSFGVNKAIQRAFTKAIGMHGLGLFVFLGEDIPKE